jgi:hypothetical protein
LRVVTIFGEMFYTLRTTQTMRAMRIIVPRMPPIYIGISVTSSEALLKHARVSLSGRYRTQPQLTEISISWAGQLPLKMRNCGFTRLRFELISQDRAQARMGSVPEAQKGSG